MTNKVIDNFVMEITPEVSKTDSKKAERNISKMLETSTASGVSAGIVKGAKMGSKGLVDTFKSAKGIIASIAATIAAPLLIAEKKAKDAIGNLQEQLDVADRLGTRATQSGIPLQDFLKLQKILEFGDVNPEAASDAIIEFEKRLGQFQKMGRGKEFFAPLGITKDTDPAQAFLMAVSAVQNLSGAQKNAAADKFFGGFGTGALAEFLGGRLKDQAKAISGIDFQQLAAQVTKGGTEQARLTQAQVQSATDKLLQTNLDATPIVEQIQGETKRTIDNANSDIRALVRANQDASNAMNKTSVSILKLSNTIAKFFESDDSYVVKGGTATSPPTAVKRQISD